MKGIGRFLYNLIKFDVNNYTRVKHVADLIGFGLYLKESGYPDIDNVQDFKTFYNGDVQLLEDMLTDYSISLREVSKVRPAKRMSTILTLYDLNRVPLPTA